MKECREISTSWEESFFDKDDQKGYLYTFELFQDGDAVRYVHKTINQMTNECIQSEKFGVIVLRHQRTHCCKIRWQDGSYSLFHLLKRRFFGNEEEMWFYPYISPDVYKNKTFLESMCLLMCNISEVASDRMVLISPNSEIIERFERSQKIHEYTAADINDFRFLIQFDPKTGLHITVCADMVPFTAVLHAHGGFAKNAQGRMMITANLQTSVCCVNISDVTLVDTVIRQFLQR